MTNVSRSSALEDLKQALLTPQGPPFTKNLGSKEACGALWTVWALSLLLQGSIQAPSLLALERGCRTSDRVHAVSPSVKWAQQQQRLPGWTSP